MPVAKPGYVVGVWFVDAPALDPGVVKQPRADQHRLVDVRVDRVCLYFDEYVARGGELVGQCQYLKMQPGARGFAERQRRDREPAAAPRQ